MSLEFKVLPPGRYAGKVEKVRFIIFDDDNRSSSPTSSTRRTAPAGSRRTS